MTGQRFSTRWKSRFITWYKRRWLRGVSPNLDISHIEEQLVAERAFNEVWFSRWYPWYLTLILGLAYMASFAVPGLLVALSNRWLWQWTEMLMGCAPFILGPPIALGIDMLLMLALRPRIHKTVRRAMRMSAIEVCVPCGYLLKGVPPESQRCPECGAAREPMAGAAS